MRGKDAVKFFTVIAVIAILTYLAFAPNGTEIPGIGTIPSAYDIRQAADLKGGIDAVLAPKDKDGKAYAAKNDELNQAKSVIEHRLDAKGVMDRVVTVDQVKKRITVQIPLKKGTTIEDPGSTIDDLGKMALLTFREIDETKSATGQIAPVSGDPILEGKNVKSAKYQQDPQDGSHDVALKLDGEGTKKFAEATARLINKRIGVFMDDMLLSAPNVKVAITDGECVIEGQDSLEEAVRLAQDIQSGAMPFKLEAESTSSISPILGSNALSVGITSGIVAFILVCLFMLIFYRLPGTLACIALLGHTVIQLLFISWFNLTMSLPGIAGLILSIGMGVDANVIIFERVKEELRNGKTLRSAIDVGFKRAFSAVLDSNITTLISAFVLLYFGTGPIKSFAYTLIVGVILNFLTAVTASRIMLKSVAGLNIAKHRWLYGVKGVKEQNG
ncbi:protein translocase subunit SecD [Pseudobacteroides cellulosolvens]|uniref:Protein translocase subunit SecD n=1 Tax=Pseudobacteroides cellulosolvens ATCC 35603 = DSM 2933 TaxID=398512 RepID=A0A0L6JJ19_9FIRM|nr:protein translocase subunit SecD [Pseudobacteroides cellulosolvens]KNY25447.1 SecD export membrane protein [Pseudobacteroides cellulosolvens ATCC 35603 = DSM 2933]